MAGITYEEYLRSHIWQRVYVAQDGCIAKGAGLYLGCEVGFLNSQGYMRIWDGVDLKGSPLDYAAVTSLRSDQKIHSIPIPFNSGLFVGLSGTNPYCWVTYALVPTGHIDP